MRVGQIMWGWGRWCEGWSNGLGVGQMVLECGRWVGVWQMGWGRADGLGPSR